VRISSKSSVLFTDDFLINNKNNFMGNLLYIVAFIFIIGWLVGFVGFQAGGAIHLLLVFAIVAVLINIIQGKKAL
jgi:uncharacterized membrane protein